MIHRASAAEINRSDPFLPRRRRIPDATVVVLGLVGVVALGGLVLAVKRAESVARESSCKGHVYKLTQAVLDYRREHGHLPGTGEKELGHSWRVLILPQLGYDDVYRKYDFSKAWNSPHNVQLLTEMPDLFSCPNCPSADCTSYFMAKGEDDSVLVFERNHQPILWIEPRDVIPDDASGEACDPGGFGVGLADGTVKRESSANQR